jgi:hypothetical protein
MGEDYTTPLLAKNPEWKQLPQVWQDRFVDVSRGVCQPTVPQNYAVVCMPTGVKTKAALALLVAAGIGYFIGKR